MVRSTAWRICRKQQRPRVKFVVESLAAASAPEFGVCHKRRYNLDQKFMGTKLTAMTDKNIALVPEEGWHCLHLFYRIEYGQWQLLSREEQNAAKTNLSSLVQEVRAMDSTQLLTLGVVTPKADVGFMLITPDLQNANKIEKQLSLSLGARPKTNTHRRWSPVCGRIP